MKLKIGENRFGGESVTYMGIDAQKKWNRIEFYDPKSVEKIVQAVSLPTPCGRCPTASSADTSIMN